MRPCSCSCTTLGITLLCTMQALQWYLRNLGNHTGRFAPCRPCSHTCMAFRAHWPLCTMQTLQLYLHSLQNALAALHHAGLTVIPAWPLEHVGRFAPCRPAFFVAYFLSLPLLSLVTCLFNYRPMQLWGVNIYPLGTVLFL